MTRIVMWLAYVLDSWLRCPGLNLNGVIALWQCLSLSWTIKLTGAAGKLFIASFFSIGSQPIDDGDIAVIVIATVLCLSLICLCVFVVVYRDTYIRRSRWSHEINDTIATDDISYQLSMLVWHFRNLVLVILSHVWLLVLELIVKYRVPLLR